MSWILDTMCTTTMVEQRYLLISQIGWIYQVFVDKQCLRKHLTLPFLTVILLIVHWILQRCDACAPSLCTKQVHPIILRFSDVGIVKITTKLLHPLRKHNLLAATSFVPVDASKVQLLNNQATLHKIKK